MKINSPQGAPLYSQHTAPKEMQDAIQQQEEMDPNRNALPQYDEELTIESQIIYKPFMSLTYEVYSFTKMIDGKAERSYQYGELDDKQDIDDFLEQVDRLEGDAKEAFKTLKPTKELLEFVKELSDEELAQFATTFERTSPFDMYNNDELVGRVIKSLSSLSEDARASAISAMSHLAEQTQVAREERVSRPKLTEEEADNRIGTLDENVDFLERIKQLNSPLYHVTRFVDLLNDKKFTDSDILELSENIKQTTKLDDSIGIVDMAHSIKSHQKVSFLELLNEVDLESDYNLFTMFGQQSSIDANTYTFDTNNGKKVVMEELLVNDSDKRELANTLITLFEERGSKWLADGLEHSQQSPAAIQTELWQNLAKAIEEAPEQFQKSDSVENWMEQTLPAMIESFTGQQFKELGDKLSEVLKFEKIESMVLSIPQTHMHTEQEQS